MSNEHLNEIRQEIDSIDEKLVELLDRRMDLALEVGNIKKEQGLPIFNPKREEEVLNKVGSKSKYPETIERVFVNIMDESKKLQENN